MISETSRVNEHVQLGTGSCIWHFCNVFGRLGSAVVIGDDTTIGSYSEIKPGVCIGSHCRVQAYAFIPDGIRIDDFVFIGPRVTFTNDTYPTAAKTIAGTWTLSCTHICDHVSIGAGVVICPGVTIGAHAFIGAGAVVTRDIPPYAVVLRFGDIVGDVRDPDFAKHLA